MIIPNSIVVSEEETSDIKPTTPVSARFPALERLSETFEI